MPLNLAKGPATHSEKKVAEPRGGATCAQCGLQCCFVAQFLCAKFD